MTVRQLLEAASEAIAEDAAPTAVTYLIAAAKQEPNNPDVMASLGWASFLAQKRSPQAAAEARKVVHAGLHHDEKHVKSYLVLGHIARIGNQLDEARRYFQRALELDPGCDEARQGIRVLDVLQGKDEPPKPKKKTEAAPRPAEPEPPPPPPKSTPPVGATQTFLRRLLKEPS